MKRASKRIPRRSSIKSQKQNNGFSHSEIILENGHFVRPSSQTSYAEKNFEIICKGYGKDAVKLAEQLLQMLKGPLASLVKKQTTITELDQRQRFGQNEQQKQRYFILNLIDSCFQELSQRKLEGSCSFGFCYIIKNELYIVKNQVIECYMMTRENSNLHYKFQPIASKNIPFQLNTVSATCRNDSLSSLEASNINVKNVTSKETKGFFFCNQNYENIVSAKFFPQVQFLCFPIPKGLNILLLLGNSQCFNHFSQKEIVEMFSCYTTLKETGKQMIEASKKKWKTIYQQDMTLIISKII